MRTDPMTWLGLTPPEPRSTITLLPGQALFRQGDPIQFLFGVTAGVLHLVRHTPDGSRVLLHTARAGEPLAEASLFADAYHCDAVAVVNAQVEAFERAAILAALARDPRAALRCAANLAGQVRHLRSRIELRDIRSAKERLLTWLRLRAEGDPPCARIDQDWTAVADEIGLRREVVYRCLSELEASCVIRRHATIVQLIPVA